MRELTVNDIGHVGGGLRIVGLAISAASLIRGSSSGGGASGSATTEAGTINCSGGTVPLVTKTPGQISKTCIKP